MKIRNQVGHYNAKKENIRFETDVEKRFHKIVSGMRYGEKLEIPVDASTPEKKKEIVNAIQKSALYNCVEIKYRVSNDKTFVVLAVEAM